MLVIVSSGSGFLIGREAMMATLREHGVNAEKVALRSTPHSFWLFDPWLRRRSTRWPIFSGAWFVGRLTSDVVRTCAVCTTVAGRSETDMDQQSGQAQKQSCLTGDVEADMLWATSAFGQKQAVVFVTLFNRSQKESHDEVQHLRSLSN